MADMFEDSMKHIAYCVLLLALAAPASGQTCASLQSASPSELVSYLNGVRDRRQNAPCVAFAIKKIGEQGYEPAIPTLTQFLEFRWPLGINQKQRRFVIEHDGFTIYPAAEALEKIGKDSLPAVLDTMKANYTSRQAMEVAVSIWMMIHKGDGPNGVALLKQEADKATDKMARSRLEFVAFRASTGWCAESERAQCEAAALKKYVAASTKAAAPPQARQP
jgi:hypothetical protein